MCEQLSEEEKRVSPQVLYRGGVQLYNVVKLKREADNRSGLREDFGDFLDYFLLGRSIELFLKSFLRGNGRTLDQLRRKISHNLDKALRKSLDLEIQRLVVLTEEEITSLALLNRYYSKKRLEYPLVGMYKLPSFHLIFGIAEKLMNSLNEFSEQKTIEFRKQNSLG